MSNVSTMLCVFLLSILLYISFAEGDKTSINPDQAKLFLLKRLAKELPDGSIIDAEGNVYFATVDTILKGHILFRYKYKTDRLWFSEMTGLFGRYIVSEDGIFHSVPESLGNIIKTNTLNKLATLVVYPHRMAANRFSGYILEPRKMAAEINDIQCIKISVRPNYDENYESSPFMGNFYISDDSAHRIIRAEHRIKRKNSLQMIRWDFRQIDGMDFPYRVLLFLKSDMCGFDMSSVIKIYFADISRSFPVDTSDTLPYINITSPPQR